jgi:Na+/melibiose symporter-like transporter
MLIGGVRQAIGGRLPTVVVLSTAAMVFMIPVCFTASFSGRSSLTALWGYRVFYRLYQPCAFFGFLILRNVVYSDTVAVMVLFTPGCAEYGRYKTGIAARGITFSTQTFSAKLISALSAAWAP